MLKSDSTATTLVVALVIAGGIIFGVQHMNANGQQSSTSASAVSASNSASASDTQASGTWVATAAGRVEPEGGEIRIGTEVAGIIRETFVKVGDRVKAGDMLFRLKDDELVARRETALNEIQVRKRERSEDPSAEENKAAAEAAKPRHDAEDAVGDAEMAFYAARNAADAAYAAWRSGNGDEATVTKAREALAEAEQRVTETRNALEEIRAKEETPLPTRLEGSLETARDDLRLLEIALERSRVRAPAAGVIFVMDATAGETVAPSPVAPLVRMGRLDSLVVHAELEERDLSAVKVGQEAVIRSNAFPGQDFTGKVTRVAPSLSAPKLGGRGPRKPADVDVIELKIRFDATTPLLPGMRVDVFFKPSAS